MKTIIVECENCSALLDATLDNCADNDTVLCQRCIGGYSRCSACNNYADSDNFTFCTSCDQIAICNACIDNYKNFFTLNKCRRCSAAS
jgi:hypothetical protein